MIHVTVWNECIHEKNMPEVAAAHPHGLHGTIAEALQEEDGFEVRTATLDDWECGLTEDVLANTDVLFWWGHHGHDQVPDEVVDRVCRHVEQGMGLVALHSSHHSKVFRRLCGMTGNLKWHHDARERIFLVDPGHPIAAGLPDHFEISSEECYCEPFSIPRPDELVFLGWFNTGEVFRSGCCFHRSRGRIFYFQPGHETGTSFFVPEIRQIWRNAARWAAPISRTSELICPHTEPLE